MKSAFTLLCGLALTPLLSAQSLVNGTNYSDLFGPNGSSVSSPTPPPILVGLHVGNSAGPSPMGTYWESSVSGAVALSALGANIAVSTPQTSLDGSALHFNLVNSGLLGDIAGLGAVNASWTSTATFDKAGNQLILQPNTTYRVSFLVDGNAGLLNSGITVDPTFNVRLLDGADTAVGSSGNGTLVNVLGLLGTGVPSGTVTVDFTTGNTVNSGPASLEFSAGGIATVSLLGSGNNFATVSGLSITQVPETSSAWLGVAGAALLLRRRRA